MRKMVLLSAIIFIHVVGFAEDNDKVSIAMAYDKIKMRHGFATETDDSDSLSRIENYLLGLGVFAENFNENRREINDEQITGKYNAIIIYSHYAFIQLDIARIIWSYRFDEDYNSSAYYAERLLRVFQFMLRMYPVSFTNISEDEQICMTILLAQFYRYFPKEAARAVTRRLEQKNEAEVMLPLLVADSIINENIKEKINSEMSKKLSAVFHNNYENTPSLPFTFDHSDRVFRDTVRQDITSIPSLKEYARMQLITLLQQCQK